MLVDALCAERDPELESLLGPAGAEALRDALRTRTRRWAHEVAPRRVWEAPTLHAAAAAVQDHAGGVLLAGWDVPGLSARLAQSALCDLAAGCTIAFAPATDGKPFLVALPGSTAFDLIPKRYLNLAEAVAAAGGPIGLLPSERRLATLADARALLADPLAPAELKDLLPPSLGG